jgi:beta-lactam-binding protein with PASTA domain
MKFSTFWRESRWAFVLKNVLLAIGIGIAVLLILLAYLKRYTEHGIEFEVPDITGMYLEEARSSVESAGLTMVIIDSTYSKKVPLGTVVEQNPPAYSHAKRGRLVYVIINAQHVRQIPLPELHDISYRQAEATLKSLGINVSNYVYEPSEYKDLILDVRQNGQSLAAGDRIDEGSDVVLVIGRGKGTEKIAVPNLCGKTLQEARSILLGKYLTLGIYEYDEAPTDETESLYKVYQQEPNAGKIVLEGSRVDLYLSKDLEKAIISVENTNDEDFF